MQAVTAPTGSPLRSYSDVTRDTFPEELPLFPPLCVSSFFLEPETTFSARLAFCFSAMGSPPYAMRFKMKINRAAPQQ